MSEGNAVELLGEEFNLEQMRALVDTMRSPGWGQFVRLLASMRSGSVRDAMADYQCSEAVYRQSQGTFQTITHIIGDARTSTPSLRENAEDGLKELETEHRDTDTANSGPTVTA